MEQHTAHVLQVTRHVVRQAQRVLTNSRRAGRQGPAAAAIQRLRTQWRTMTQRTTQVMVQTTQRLQGVLSIPIGW